MLLSANRLSQIPPAGRHDSGSDTSCIKHGFDFFFFLPLLGTCVCAHACLIVSLSKFNQSSLVVWRIDGSLISTFPILPPSLRHASVSEMDVQAKKENMHTMPHAHKMPHTHSRAGMCTFAIPLKGKEYFLQDCAADCHRASAQEADLKLQTR